jgi:tetratricopeptide (TPR) repeat protein
MIREGKSWSGREPNTAYLNAGDGSFADISFASQIAFPDDARAMAPVDWDEDGDLDVWLACRTAPKVRYLRNDAGNGGRYVSFALRGDSVNRDGIGARIDLRVGSQRQVQLRQAGSGYLAQKSALVTFSLGQAERADEVRVRWPDGSTQHFESVAAGSRYLITQGDARLTYLPPLSTQAARTLARGSPTATAPSPSARIALAARRPMPEVSISDSTGQRHVLGGKPLLINFWTSTCDKCMAELGEWSRESATWKSSGLSILALSVDSQADAAEAMSKLGPQFAWGVATDEWIQLFDVLQRWVVDRQDELRVPTSFLIDPLRRLAYVYRGAVSAQQLARDVATLSASEAEIEVLSRALPGRRAHAPGLPGMVDIAGELHERGQLDAAAFYLELGLRGLGDPRAGGAMHSLAAAALTKVGTGYVEAKRFANAIALLERANEFDARDGARWFTLGEAYFQAGQKAKSIEALKRATELEPKLAAAWLRLGVALNEVGDGPNAVRVLGKATELAPDDWRGWYTLGGALLAQQSHVEALPHFKKSTELNPQHARSWTGLGTCLGLGGDRPAALAALEKALALDPSDARTAGLLKQWR